ncbi:MAG: hypothetical protein BGP16_09210 [Sphingobium sp. 66-54]|nr:MAG: hypothetical protein BGP16_09210 [Sphingobium sp. 66-54]
MVVPRVRALMALTALLPALSACGGAVIPQGARPAAGFTPASRPEPGGVMGADARGLRRLFGEPRLDIRDPAARKLQFANGQCILDTYLYAPAAGREPVVTHVDARTGAGADMEWQACVRLLRAK